MSKDYGHYNLFDSFSDFRRQNLTSKVDPRAVRDNPLNASAAWATGHIFNK